MVLSLMQEKLHYDSAQMEALSRQIRLGDLTPVMQIYEENIKSPLKSAAGGTLLRTLLIQAQKAKVCYLFYINIYIADRTDSARAPPTGGSRPSTRRYRQAVEVSRADVRLCGCSTCTCYSVCFRPIFEKCMDWRERTRAIRRKA